MKFKGLEFGGNSINILTGLGASRLLVLTATILPRLLGFKVAREPGGEKRIKIGQIKMSQDLIFYPDLPAFLECIVKELL